MRILVDAYWWVDGPYSNRLVLREIVRQWSSQFPQDHLVLAIPSKWKDSEIALPSGVERIETRMRRHPAINAIELPLYAKSRKQFDAILLQNFGAPSADAAVLVHDVLFQSNPEWFTRVERLYLSAIPFLARRTGRVMTTTRSEARRISSYNSLPDRVTITGLGLSTTLLGAVSRKPQRELRAGSFILTVGRLNIRKNLENTIIGAIASGAISADFPLVVVGQRSGRSGINDTISACIEAGSILYIEFAEDAELRWLYENCALFCFLSLGEGYGLPPVEAAYFGAQILASDIPVMRENLGPHAEYVDPESTSAISIAIARLLACNATYKRISPTESLREIPIPGGWESTVEIMRSALQEMPRVRK